MASSSCSSTSAPESAAASLREKQDSTSYFNPLDRTTPSLPLCLYYTQGCCTNMDDATHLKAFDPSSLELNADAFDLKLVQPQQFDYFLVLDLEGKKEILEFPVVMIDAKTTRLVGFFHRFVRPTGLSKEDADEDVDKHFGKFGISNVWHHTAIPFEKVIREFESYFREWINLKDVYLNFYKRKARGMLAMMWPLKITVAGNHHLGIDDATNIARVLQRMIVDGTVLQISARRNNEGKCEFLFENRIKW